MIGKDKNKNKNGCKKRRAKKRKTPFQLKKLEEAYALEIYPSAGEQRNLGESIGLTQTQVQMWFSFRRLKDRKKDSALVRHKMDESVGASDHCSPSKSSSGSGSASGSGSDSSRSNEPLEAANTLGQNDSQQPLPQTITPTKIEPCIEKGETARVEKKVKTRVAPHVDSEEKMQVGNVNLRKDVFESCRQELINYCVGVGGGGSGDNGGGGGGSGDNGGGGGGGGDDLKNNMIHMLTERNKRDRAKYESLLNEIACLGKSIEATDKLIDDIKKVC